MSVIPQTPQTPLAWLRRPVPVRVPWGSWLGVARTILALATAGTLALTDPDALFGQVLGSVEAPYCDGLASISAFCVLPREQLGLLRWVAVGILLVVASGWRPRWTAIPHWWVTFSVFNSVSITDGGDQAALVLTTLLLPVALTDARRWHWERGSVPFHDAASPRRLRPSAVAVALVLLIAVKIQVSVLYFQASVAKLGQAEWVDGTGMYYWMQDTVFGPPDWLREHLQAAVDQQVVLLAVTWAPLVIEFALALSLLLPQRVRWALLPLGIGLHLSIAVIMGLWSFSLVMVAACLLLLLPVGEDVQGTRDRLRALTARNAPAPAASDIDAGSPRDPETVLTR